MAEIENEGQTTPTKNNNNKTDVKINNHFSLTINFGDSLNLIALIAGVYIVRKLAKGIKNKKKQQK